MTRNELIREVHKIIWAHNIIWNLSGTEVCGWSFKEDYEKDLNGRVELAGKIVDFMLKNRE